MSETPPAFQEAARCDVCKCSFNAFRRRHHCRCCGRTLCNEHSSNQMALPQFGIYTDVRVCFDCFNISSWTKKGDSQASSDAVATAADKFSELNVDGDITPESKSVPEHPVLSAIECKCGMPLCICEAPTPKPVPSPMQNTSTRSNPKPKKASSTKQMKDSASARPASSSSTKPSSFFNLGQASNASLDKASTDYETSGEGLREAIKNNDAIAVKELLTKGVDANYCDKQGSTLLHLAAVFNHTEIAFILMEHGASVERKNAQGETPLDCAPTMLQFKMRAKIEEGKEAK